MRLTRLIFRCETRMEMDAQRFWGAEMSNSPAEINNHEQPLPTSSHHLDTPCLILVNSPQNSKNPDVQSPYSQQELLTLETGNKIESPLVRTLTDTLDFNPSFVLESKMRAPVCGPEKRWTRDRVSSYTSERDDRHSLSSNLSELCPNWYVPA